jgi:integrase
VRVTHPHKNEPIRLVERKKEPGYYVAIDTAAKGQKRKQVTRTFDTLGQARAFVIDTRAALTRGTFAAPSKMTVRELAASWLAEREEESAAGGIREVSVNGYRSALSKPLHRIGDEHVQSIDPAAPRALLRWMSTEGGKSKRGLSHRSIEYALTTLRQVFAFGVENGICSKNPASVVKVPKARAGDRREIVVWTASELATFRDYVDGLDDEVTDAEPWLRASMRLTLCGLRRSEVLGLDWRNVDLEAGTVRIIQGRVKTGRGSATVHGEAKSDDSRRTVPVETIHSGTRAILRALWMLQGQPSTGLVVVDAVGDPVHPDTVSRRFRALSDDAAVPDLGSIHNVRHTVATALHDSGVEPRKAASLLGHKVTTHLAYYVPTSDAGASEAAAIAGNLFRAAN